MGYWVPSKQASVNSHHVLFVKRLLFYVLLFFLQKFSKGPNSGKTRWNFFLIWSGNLLIMPYQLTKFQAPSSNTFRDILLTILKWPNFQRAVNLEKYGDHFFLIWSGNLLIIPYQLTKFQAPSSNKFWDMLLTSLKCPNLQKAITPEKQVAQRATIAHLSPMCQGQMWSFSNKSMGTFCFRDMLFKSVKLSSLKGK